MSFDFAGKRVFVAGHRGMVGSALMRRLANENCTLLTAARDSLDLRDQAAVRRWFEAERPDAVFLAAARVGGILANETQPADFLTDNLLIGTNVIDAAHRTEVAKLLYIASSAVYPRLGDVVVTEEALLTGPPEPSHDGYAIAKIAGIKACQAYRRQYGRDYIAVVPTNLYGPGDRYDLATSHVVPAIIRKVHEARQAGAPSITIWGTGAPRREFLHADDMADACTFLMRNYSGEMPINIGSGSDVTILELTELVMAAVGYRGAIERDLTKPDGAMRRLMSSARLADLGWRSRIGLGEGLADAYRGFLEHERSAPKSTDSVAV
jgi:GDP-L-fucose synthase